MRATGGGGGAGTIVVDIDGVLRASALVADASHAYALLASRVRSRPLPEMPPDVAARVAFELSEVCCDLGSEPQPLLDIAKELRVRAFWAQVADKLESGYDLSGAQLTEFKAAYASGLLLRYAEPWQGDLARAYAQKVHDEEHPGGFMGFVHGVGDFFSGAWDAIKDPAVMLYHLTPLSSGWEQQWSNLGHGLAFGVTHPLEFGKALINLDGLEQRGFAYWIGNLAPAAAATLLSGGAAAGLRGAEGAAAVDRVTEGAAALDRAAEAADALPGIERGMTVWRLHGWNEEASGLRLVEGATGPDGISSVASGSGPWGHSWTHVDPTALDDPRATLGLPTGPDGNPARFLSTGVLEDTTGVTERAALPLDGNAGGWPELLVPDAERQISLTGIYGLNPSP